MESLYSRPYARLRYSEGPFLKEREHFLAHQLAQGHPPQLVRATASTLLRVIQFLELRTFREVSLEELGKAAERWIRDGTAHGYQGIGPKSKERFIRIGRQWLGFHKMLVVPQTLGIQFSAVLGGFTDHLERSGIGESTIKSWRHRAKLFLVWLAERASEFSRVSLRDVDDFIEAKTLLGWTAGTLKTLCQALRKLFRYAEAERLCSSSIAQGIISPSVPLYNTNIVRPSWQEVRATLDVASRGITVSGLRAHAILCLSAIYALRGVEISGLRLEDIDWRKEVLTIRRAKGGRIQQYPLQYEVGEAVIKYLQLVRPMCVSRRIFITLGAPYRPMTSSTICHVIGQRLKRMPEITGRASAHALRHACATKLLHRGSSLQYISNFLGHKDPKSVSIYAKYDKRTLKQVTDFGFVGIV